MRTEMDTTFGCRLIKQADLRHIGWPFNFRAWQVDDTHAQFETN